MIKGCTCTRITVDEKGRIVIPEPLRYIYNLKHSSLLEFKMVSGREGDKPITLLLKVVAV